jgi:hypothetical protein
MPVEVPNPVLAAALAYAEAGFRVHPIRARSKVALLPRWPERASTDPADMRGWFRDESLNVALACGPQPNGQDLLVIDVDAHKGGELAWRKLVRTYGAGDLPSAAIHRTPNGGWHILLGVPPTVSLRNTAARLGDGIDTRGDGGYVLAPPSRIADPVTGEVLAYTVQTGLVDHPDLVLMPDWLVELLTREDPLVAAARRHPSQFELGDSVADLARVGWDWPNELLRDGWTAARVNGSESQWTRPGKDPRLGSSATLHGDGPLVVWSTSVPVGGRSTQGGVGQSYSPWDYLVTFRCGGDTRRAAALVRGTVPRPAPAGGQVRAALSSAVDDTPGRRDHPRNLPADFWSLTPFLQHVFVAARESMASPDALLVSTLARVSALIPPCYRLPAVIGTQMGLDFMGCVVAETSGGKGLATGVARRLIPAPIDDLDDAQVMMDVPVGSGEGLVQAFMVPEIDGESGKPTGRQRVGKQALHFTVDEAMALIQQGGREGATILATMCSAWSGEALGQMNARKETRRVIPPGKVRVAAVLNMQVSNAWRLFEPTIAALGFTGRVVFGSAIDPSSKDDFDKEWPEQEALALPAWPMFMFGSERTLLTYDPAIRAEIRRTRQGVLDGSSQIDMLRSQYLLARCKVAGIFTMLDDERHITQDRWEMAGIILDTSSAVLDYLQEQRSQALRDQRHTLGEARGEIQDTADEVKDRRARARIAAWILTKLADGPKTLPWLLRNLASRDRDHLEAAVVRLLEDGVARVDDVDMVSTLTRI